jgi:hypothetical protein
VRDGTADLRVVLETLDPKARDTLRRVLIHDKTDYDVSSRQCVTLMGEATPLASQGLNPKARDKLRRVLIWDLIDFLSNPPREERREALRLLNEIEAAQQR